MNDVTAQPRPPEGRQPGANGNSADPMLTALVQDERRESPLAYYLQVLLRRRWFIVATVLLSIALAAYINATTVRLYRSTGTIEIAREAARVIDADDGSAKPAFYSQEFYQTQYGLLKSRALAEMVVRKLNLANNPTFMYGYSGREPGEQPRVLGAEQRKNLERAAAGMLMANLTIEPTRSSSLVSISFDSPDPQLSARIVNTLSESFIEQNLARRFAASSYARKYLEDRIAQTRARLEESERKIVDYASDQRIITVDTPQQKEGGGTAAAPSLVGIELGALSSALTTAKADRVAAEARYNEARQSGPLAASEGLTDNTITALRGQRAELMGEYSKLLARFEPEYPAAVALKRQIDEIDRQLRTQGGNVLASLRSNYEAAAAREAQLQAQVDGLKDGVIDLRRRSIQYNIYQRDADTNRSLYDALLQRYKEIGVAGGVGTNNVSIVDSAMPSYGPIKPRTTMNLLLATMLGLFLGAALAFLVEQLDQSIMAPDDLEWKLGIPLLGSIPRLPETENLLEALEDRRTPLAESYLSLFTALRFTTSHGAPRVIFMTSSRAAEGKSTSSVALARNFAQLGKKVLLIDADMRDPSIHHMLKLTNSGGLTNVLAGADDLQRFIQKGPHEKMAVMTAGPIPPNPAELLAGPNLPLAFETLLKSFDHIVIDGPPVLGLADAPLIANYAEATVFVIASKQTRTKVVRVSLRRLADVNARIVGAVLTKFDAKTSGYSYAYSYEYGDRRGRQSKSLARRILRG
ncbi:GumC family protein [Sphingomonas sp.]|uniref:GumC family protein n=1 Tax=Sphingomonas sp. TaxID=28214 RepID=UPI003F7085B7